MGQYLQASKTKLLVKQFVTPEQFKVYEEFGLKLGVKFMYCGPFVRSSYNANLFVPGMKNAIDSE
jgi:lipoic acid synthetase